MVAWAAMPPAQTFTLQAIISYLSLMWILSKNAVVGARIQRFLRHMWIGHATENVSKKWVGTFSSNILRLTAHQYDSFSPALSLQEKCCTSRYELWVCGQRAVHGIQIRFTWVVSSGWHSSSTHRLESGRKRAPRGFSDSLLEFLDSISLRKFFSVELQRRLYTYSGIRLRSPLSGRGGIQEARA